MNKDKQSQREPHYSVENVYPEPSKEKTSIQRRADGAFVFNGGTKRQITLIGATEQEAHAIKRHCDSVYSSSIYDATLEISEILMESAIQVEEVNTFKNEVRPIIEKRVQKLIAEDKEWESLGEMDKRDKRMEFVGESMVTFHEDITPVMERALSYLAMNEAVHVPLFDEFVERYGLNNLSTYSSYVGRKNPIISIPNPNYRKPLEDLVKVGLASTGNDMSVEELLSSLTLNKLNEISGADTKFTRKEKAIKYISEKDNVASIIDKNVVLRSLFVLKPLPDEFQEFNFDKLRESAAYYEELADVVVSVYNGLSPISYKKR